MQLAMQLTLAVYTCVTLAGTALAVRYYLHMLQLNSYKNDAQRRWLHLPQNHKKSLLLLIPLAGGFFFLPRKAKKPLVYTARVKRLLVTIAVLILALTACTQLLFFWLSDRDTIGLVIALIWLLAVQCNAPSFVMFANTCNRPIESAIRNRYIKEAKEKLAACPNLTVIGITGSFGKTSVKHYLNTLLRAKYNVLMTPGGANVPMSVVRTIREQLTAAHEVFICEMGAKQLGDIKELCDIVHPKHGILTSIGPQHLETFGSLENVIATKFELGDALPSDGILFANGDDSNIRQKLGGYPNVVTYASNPNGSTYYAEDIAADARGTTFTVVTPQGEREIFTVRLIGRHNVENLVGAIACAHTLGVSLRDLKGQMRKIAPVQHRLELIDRGDVLVIDDAYNSNPTGAKAALDTLALFDGMKILVTPGMIELGERQTELNRIFGTQAAAVCDYIALVGAAQTKPIRDGIIAAGFDSEKLIVADNLQDAMAAVYALPCAGRKIILLENDLPDNF